MSILLDSLRKSEAQRKIKDAPTIHSAEAYGSRGRRQRQWLALAMTGLTAVAIAWFGWQQFAEPDSTAGTPSGVAAADRASPAGNGEAAGRDVLPEPAPDGGEARTPVERLSQGPESPAADSSTSTSPADRIAAFVAEQEEQTGEDEGAIGEEFAEEGEEVVAAEESAGDDLAADFGSDDLSDFEPPARKPGLREEPGESGPRSYWHLPQSWRSEMPEFRITVLVYAEAAEDRFLLINGERLREGDALEGGVVLEEIRRDGAVFSYRQTRFLVKS